MLFIRWLAVKVMGAAYYANSAAGNNANGGTAKDSAWQTLAKVNGQTYSPGDDILIPRKHRLSTILPIVDPHDII